MESNNLRPDPASLAPRSIPPLKLLLTPLARSKRTSILDDIPHLCSFFCVSEYITPPSIQTAPVECPFAEVDLAIGMLGCKPQDQRCRMRLERFNFR